MEKYNDNDNDDDAIVVVVVVVAACRRRRRCCRRLSHHVELVAALKMQLEDDVRVSALALNIQVRNGPLSLLSFPARDSPLSLSTSHVPLAVQTEVVR